MSGLKEKDFTKVFNRKVLRSFQELSARLVSKYGYTTTWPAKTGEKEWAFVVSGRDVETKELKHLGVILEFNNEPEFEGYIPVLHFMMDGNPMGSYEFITVAHEWAIVESVLYQIWSDTLANAMAGKINDLMNPLARTPGVLEWSPEIEDIEVVVDKAPTSYSADVVKGSLFDVEVEFTVPKWFWSEEGVAPWQDPEEQMRLWEEGKPLRRAADREEWMERFHDALELYGWPRQNLDALYSYFEQEVENPDEGEERDPDIPDVMRFRVNIDGEWLLEHPTFLANLERYNNIPIRGEVERSGIGYYRIVASRGPLDGAVWEDPGGFVVRLPLLELAKK